MLWVTSLPWTSWRTALCRPSSEAKVPSASCGACVAQQLRLKPWRCPCSAHQLQKRNEPKKSSRTEGFFLVVELVVGLRGMEKKNAEFFVFFGWGFRPFSWSRFFGILWGFLGHFSGAGFLTFYQRSSCFHEMTLVDFESVVIWCGTNAWTNHKGCLVDGKKGLMDSQAKKNSRP